ncbi:MAG TPA: hypothetical protein PK131_00335 [Candidatus Woesebacteria bacterium]|nr:hypothetical protein [Candidatus Woesebacteria bacterium]HRS23017.1 hypothetical protein [Candidatus Woesebacteria bacterium]HRT39904.1 hypothetical protein [Candidatus Woesebacteria bacterium]
MLIRPVYANCPACIVTVGGGLFLAEKLHIDVFLISIWLSALNSAIAYFLASKIKRKVLNQGFFWSLIFYLLTVVYLDFSGRLRNSNPIWGIDRCLLGLSCGLILFIFSIYLDQLLRRLNRGKVVFFYQKVIIPLLVLTAATIMFKQWL